MRATRKRKEKWAVYGEYGGYFTNMKEAWKCAKEYSKICPDERIDIWLLEDDLSYFTYMNGKCVRDGWTVHK